MSTTELSEGAASCVNFLFFVAFVVRGSSAVGAIVVGWDLCLDPVNITPSQGCGTSACSVEVGMTETKASKGPSCTPGAERFYRMSAFLINFFFAIMTSVKSVMVSWKSERTGVKSSSWKSM